jgi:hypothetical protein
VVALVASACSSAPALIGGDRDKVKPGETGGAGFGTDAGTAGKPETGGDGAGGSTGSGGAAGGGSVDPCAAQDAHTVGSCEPFRGYAWNGQACEVISGCSCQGADCDNLFSTEQECQSAYTACLPKGQCDDARTATLDFIAKHKECTVDEDCTLVPGGCTITEASCTGLVYVNTASTVDANFDELRQKLHDCIGAATCDGPICDLGPPPAACIEGRCAPGTFQ